jgi:hypothetical protein
LGSRAGQQISQGIRTGDRARLEKAARLYARRQQEREKTYARLKSQARKTFFLVIALALLVAGIADVLSIIDLGWVVSWLIPIISWFIVRRISAINQSVDHIKSAQQDALKELRIMRQRLRPALLASNQYQLFATAETLEIRQAVGSYARTFFRDTIITQLVELIPGIDVLPMYLGQVVKVINDQRKAYHTAQEVLVPYRQTLDLLLQLEHFEVQGVAQPALAAAATYQPA